jgi:hypothetical protein
LNSMLSSCACSVDLQTMIFSALLHGHSPKIQIVTLLHGIVA